MKTTFVFYRGHMVSDNAMQSMIGDMMYDEHDTEEYNRLEASYIAHMTDALNALDNRLWWIPEFSEVLFSGDRDEMDDLSLRVNFEDWWEEMTGEWFESEC